MRVKRLWYFLLEVTLIMIENVEEANAAKTHTL